MSTTNARELAAAFSAPVARELSKPHPAEWAHERVAPVAALVDDSAPLSEAFETAYGLLAAEYRCEYVYKTSLINELAAASPSAHAIPGLPVCMSIADVVVADESASAFEIKTDLDSLARLDLQVFSYSRCFEYVQVVTSGAKAPKVLSAVPDHVGVLAVDDSGALEPVRAAIGGYSRLDIGSLFRVLRRDERLAVLNRHIGYSADVPNALLYRRTAELFMQIPIEEVYCDFVAQLRGRDARNRAAARQAGLPSSLVAAAAGLKLSGIAWRRLGGRLMQPCSQLAARP